MIKLKYYQPTIEEFHIGFEFEVEAPLSGWIKCVCKQGDFENIFKNIPAIDIRVQYPDHYDIISLGWKLLKQGETTFIYGKEYYNERFGAVDTMKVTFIPSTNWFLFYGAHEPRFCGVLKNKSEVKRIMEQIGMNKVAPAAMPKDTTLAPDECFKPEQP